MLDLNTKEDPLEESQVNHMSTPQPRSRKQDRILFFLGESLRSSFVSGFPGDPKCKQSSSPCSLNFSPARLEFKGGCAVEHSHGAARWAGLYFKSPRPISNAQALVTFPAPRLNSGRSGAEQDPLHRPGRLGPWSNFSIMNAAAKAGKLARAPADLGKGGVPGDAAPGAPVTAPLAKEIPEVLVDPRSRRQYVRGRFLGKGGFAKCFEISDADTKEVFAGKIVPKSLLLKPHQKEKMSMEISIHRSLAHQHVVGFHGFFEDSDFVFVVLELCRRRVSVSVAVLGLPHMELAGKGAPKVLEWPGGVFGYQAFLWKGF